MVKPKARFYKIIGTCRSCKTTFTVDIDNRNSSRNYCKACTMNFRRGGN